MEYLVQSRFAYIQSYQNDLFAEQCQADGKIGSHECLTFTAYGGGDEDYFLVRVTHDEEQVGAQATESFCHDIIVVFADGDSRCSIFTSIGKRYVTNNGDGCKLFHVGVPFDTKTE